MDSTETLVSQTTLLPADSTETLVSQTTLLPADSTETTANQTTVYEAESSEITSSKSDGNYSSYSIGVNVNISQPNDCIFRHKSTETPGRQLSIY